MSLFNPPNSPSTGVTYSFGSNIWEWNGYAWIKEGTVSTQTQQENIYWTRPEDWLTLPELTQGDQKFTALFAIFSGASGGPTGSTASGNFVALSMTGAFIVDWGNGVTQAFNSGVTAQYQYTWDSIPNSTLTSNGYKQVIIQAYPQAGNTFTVLDLRRRYTQPGVTLTNVINQYLDIKIAGPHVTRMDLSTAVTDGMRLVQSFEYVGTSSIVDGSLSSLSSFGGLQNLAGTSWTSNITNFSSMFSFLSYLRKFPAIDTSAGNTFTSAFRGVGAFEFPLINTSNASTFDSAWRDCSALVSFPLIDMSKTYSLSNAFNGCRGLISIPKWNTSRCDQWIGTFQTCTNLQKIPDLAGNCATNLNAFCAFCPSLQEIGEMTVPNVWNFSSTFFSSPSIKKLFFKDINVSFDCSSLNLSAGALNDVFTNLGLTGSAKTVTITGNWGASGCNRSIATAKGWAVSG